VRESETVEARCGQRGTRVEMHSASCFNRSTGSSFERGGGGRKDCGREEGEKKGKREKLGAE